jgi:hypothetical protein
MKRYLFLIFICVTTRITAQSFETKGVLSWHNFLSGPTAWNEDDYRGWLRSVYEFTLLLDDVSRSIEPAWKLRELYMTGKEEKDITSRQIDLARETLAKAPIESMIRTFASRVRSRGELGGLASINQRVWGEYLLLRDFLNNN